MLYNRSLFLSLLCLALPLALSSCAHQQSAPATLDQDNPYITKDALKCHPIPLSQPKNNLCVMFTVNRGDMWFTIGNTEHSDHTFINGFSVLEGSLDGPVFSDFSISPGGNYLAVLTAAEGHPTLMFEHMHYLIHGDTTSNPLPSFSVYPGTVFLDYWLSDNKAVIVSNQDLSNYTHGSETGAAKSYILHLPEGNITPYLE